jgi:hypothetical protein
LSALVLNFHLNNYTSRPTFIFFHLPGILVILKSFLQYNIVQEGVHYACLAWFLTDRTNMPTHH